MELKRGLLGISLLSLLSSPAAHSGSLPYAVEGWGEHKGDAVIYQYRIKNVNGKPITGITIGFDPASAGTTVKDASGYPKPSLQRYPAGTYVTEDGLLVTPDESIRAPYGWVSELELDEPTGQHYIRWGRLRSDGVELAPAIGPGETGSGFAVVVPLVAKYPESGPLQADFYYLSSGFFVSALGPKTIGLITRADTHAPTLELQSSPSIIATATQQLVDVQIGVEVQDAFDGEPRVRLEAITANVPLQEGRDYSGADLGKDDRQFKLLAAPGPNNEERVYTIRYSAVDGSGNRSEKTTEVRVKAPLQFR